MSKQQQFIQTLLPGALEAARRTGLDPRLIIAQAAQETGWGRSAPGNNYFGIKSHGKSGGQTFKTHEYVNGRRVNISDSFRSYASPYESALGYAEFLQTNPRYRHMLAAPDLESQVAALGQSGYATDPNYANSVLNIAKTINLDGVNAPPQLSPEALAFAYNNPQPGGYGPEVEAQVERARTGQQPSGLPSPGMPFGLVPMASDPLSPVPEGLVKQDEKKKTPAQVLGEAFSALGASVDRISPPRPSAHPGGPSANQTNALLQALTNPSIAELLLKQRRGGLT